jgi:cell division protease FtsH
MVMEFGMSDELGPISYGSGHDEVFMGRDFGKSRNFSEEVAARIDSEIRRFIDEAYMKAERLLTENVDKLHTVAQALLEKEKLEADEFEELFNRV